MLFRSVTDLEAVGQEHVALLAVAIVEQADPRRAVRVVLDGREPGGYADLVALEVDPPVAALRATAAMACGDAPPWRETRDLSAYRALTLAWPVTTRSGKKRRRFPTCR